MSDQKYRVAVVGASGLVGREALLILSERGHDPDRVVALASSRSAGTQVPFGTSSLVVSELKSDSFDDIDFVILCADSDTARRVAPLAIERGATVIDNSSAFRMNHDVPLVIPEINGHLLESIRSPRLVANPNCSTIILLTAIEPIRRAFGLESIVVSTYQAVSGAGRVGVESLVEETRAIASGSTAESRYFPEPCAMNVFTHESPLDPETNLNGEEQKIICESRKILNDEQVQIAPTCVRVPVERAHSQSITIRLRQSANREDIESLLIRSSSIELWPSTGQSHPTPLASSGRDKVQVGRVRMDPLSYGHEVSLWVCGDQLRKGAALNAIQIAEFIWMNRCGFACRSISAL